MFVWLSCSIAKTRLKFAFKSLAIFTNDLKAQTKRSMVVTNKKNPSEK